MAVEHLCQRHGRPAVASRVRLRPDGTQETDHLCDTVEPRRSTTFKCAGSAAAPVKTAITDENMVVLLADFYRAGDESVTAQMIVSADDAASDIAWIQNAWIQGAAAPRGIANFSS
jgi:hypothetical protein